MNLYLTFTTVITTSLVLKPGKITLFIPEKKKAFQQKKRFCSIVIYPVIPKGLILLRLIPTAMHTLDDVNESIAAFSAIRDKLEKGIYKRIAASLME